MKDDQNFWFFVFTLFFILVFILLEWILYAVNGYVPRTISWFDAILILLASFRLTRLFVYDHIMQFVRDWFLDKRETRDERGVLVLALVPPVRGPKKTLWHLSNCAWCAGLWFSMLVSFFYFLTPLAWFPIFVLAIAGIATFVQIFSQLVGWSAEKRKLEVAREK